MLSASHPLAHAPRRGTDWEPLSRLGLLADGQSEICLIAGGVVTDFDGDGMLDLILSHGESMAQPLSVFRGNQVCMDPGTCRTQPSVSPGSRVIEGRGARDASLPSMVENGHPENKFPAT